MTHPPYHSVHTDGGLDPDAESWQDWTERRLRVGRLLTFDHAGYPLLGLVDAIRISWKEDREPVGPPLE